MSLMCSEKSLEDDKLRGSAGFEADKHNLGYGCVSRLCLRSEVKVKDEQMR
jgi:hypothetical protein